MFCNGMERMECRRELSVQKLNIIIDNILSCAVRVIEIGSAAEES